MTTLGIREVVVQSREVLGEARKFNRRAGKDIFPIPSRSELARSIRDSLKGAFSASQGSFDPKDIAVPPLDPKKVREFSELYPASITVFERTCDVEYPECGPPRVVLRLYTDEVPDVLDQIEGVDIKLPDGREVEVAIAFGTRNYGSRDMSVVRHNLAEDYLDALWANWIRPEPEVPESVLQGEGELPEIVTVEWNKHPLTGETLYAYGVLRVNPLSIRVRIDSSLRWAWFRNEQQAQLEYNLSVQAFRNYREQLRVNAARLRAEQERANRFEDRYQKRVEAIQQKARKSEYESAIKGSQAFGYLRVQDDVLWINCDEQGKVRNMEISPALGCPVELDIEVSEGQSHWLPVRRDSEIHFRSPLLWGRAASLLEPFTMKIANGKLSNGVWAFGKSGDLYFFPAIYSTGGVEMIPDEVRRVEEVEVL